MSAPDYPLATLRNAVAKRVEESSYRKLAEEIGMNWSVLRDFAVLGRTPHRATLHLLTTWHYHKVRGSKSVPRKEVDAAIAFLRNYVWDASKPRSVRSRRLREVIEELNAASEKPPPE